MWVCQLRATSCGGRVVGAARTPARGSQRRSRGARRSGPRSWTRVATARASSVEEADFEGPGLARDPQTRFPRGDSAAWQVPADPPMDLRARKGVDPQHRSPVAWANNNHLTELELLYSSLLSCPENAGFWRLVKREIGIETRESRDPRHADEHIAKASRCVRVERGEETSAPGSRFGLGSAAIEFLGEVGARHAVGRAGGSTTLGCLTAKLFAICGWGSLETTMFRSRGVMGVA